LFTHASTRGSDVAAVEVDEQKLAGTVRITIASALRRLWSSWQNTERVRHLAANDEQVIAFATAGLREATGVNTLTVVDVSGGPSEWWVFYEIPTPGMGLAGVYSLSDQVQQKLSGLEIMNSPQFVAFERGAFAAGSSLQLQSIVAVSGPLAMSAPLVQYSVDSSPQDARGTIPAISGTANDGVFIAVLLALFGVVSAYC